MPIYEYFCETCGRISSHLVLNTSDFRPSCRNCGSLAVRKLISRVHVRLSEESRMERLADPGAMAGLDETDPRSIGKWMKKMGGAMGEDMEGDFDQMVEEAVEEAACGGPAGKNQTTAGEDSSLGTGNGDSASTGAATWDDL